MSKTSYPVGYGITPEHTRFKKGESGNPKGRPKKLKSFDKIIQEELNRCVRVTIDGEERTLSKKRLFVHNAINEAIKNPTKSGKILLDILERELWHL